MVPLPKTPLLKCFHAVTWKDFSSSHDRAPPPGDEDTHRVDHCGQKRDFLSIYTWRVRTAPGVALAVLCAANLPSSKSPVWVGSNAAGTTLGCCPRRQDVLPGQQADRQTDKDVALATGGELILRAAWTPTKRDKLRSRALNARKRTLPRDMVVALSKLNQAMEVEYIACLSLLTRRCRKPVKVSSRTGLNSVFLIIWPRSWHWSRGAQLLKTSNGSHTWCTACCSA